MNASRRGAIVCVMGILASAVGFAQAPVPQAPKLPAAPAQKPGPGSGPTPSPAGKPAAPQEAQGYTYNPEGRRDPFVSLLRGGADSQRQVASARALGLSGLGTSDVALKGTIQSGSDYVGLLQGVDNRTYIVKPGDRLLDGTIRTISANALVILQQVNDPLSLQKEREVRKVLRRADEGK
jgi:Tfp pilus assembly protein PilP